MVSVLEKFEDVFPDLENTDDGRKFKYDIKNALNDTMRATRDELNDYEVDYRPMRMNEDNILSLTRTLLESIEKIDFDDTPSVKIICAPSKLKVLESVRNEFGGGIIYSENNVLVLHISGLDICVNNVVPILDKYRFVADVKTKYIAWRRMLIAKYVGEG